MTVTATANDAEEGDVTAKIVWSDLATPVATRVTGSAGRFTLTPNAWGSTPCKLPSPTARERVHPPWCG